MDDKAARQDDRSLGQPRNSLLSSRRIRAWSIPVDLDSYLFLERLRRTVRHMRYLFRRHVLFSHRDTPPLFLQGLSVRAQAHRQQDPCLTTDWQAGALLTARKRHWTG